MDRFHKERFRCGESNTNMCVFTSIFSSQSLTNTDVPSRERPVNRSIIPSQNRFASGVINVSHNPMSVIARANKGCCTISMYMYPMWSDEECVFLLLIDNVFYLRYRLFEGNFVRAREQKKCRRIIDSNCLIRSYY